MFDAYECWFVYKQHEILGTMTESHALGYSTMFKHCMPILIGMGVVVRHTYKNNMLYSVNLHVGWSVFVGLYDAFISMNQNPYSVYLADINND